MRVEVRGVIYPSVKACAEALGVSTGSVYRALSSGKVKTLGIGKGNVSTSHKVLVKKKPLIVAGYPFPSIAALALTIGRCPRGVRRSLYRGEKAQAGLIRAVMELVAARENAAMKARKKESDALANH